MEVFMPIFPKESENESPVNSALVHDAVHETKEVRRCRTQTLFTAALQPVLVPGEWRLPLLGGKAVTLPAGARVRRVRHVEEEIVE